MNRESTTRKQRYSQFAVAALALISLAGCQSMQGCFNHTPAQKQPPTGPILQPTAPSARKEPPVTGLHGFQQTYIAAHTWAADASPERLWSEPTPNVTGQGGKAAVWHCTFASPSKKLQRTFTYAAYPTSEEIPQGISFSPEDSWSPANHSTETFRTEDMKVDSDLAYDVAQQHGGAKFDKKNGALPVAYSLNWNPAKNLLYWRVTYGTNEPGDRLNVDVNATDGKYLGHSKQG